MLSVTLNDQERHEAEHQQMLAPYVAQNKRLLALLREAIEEIEDLTWGYTRLGPKEDAGVIWDWVWRAKAEVE